MQSDREHAERLTNLDALGKELLAELDRGRLLRLVTDRASALFQAAGAIYVVRDDGLEADIWTGYAPARLPMGAGVVGASIAERRGLVVNNYPAWPRALPDAVARGVHSVMAHPLVVGGELFGAISMNRLDPAAPPFTPADLDTLGLFATAAALALRNAILYERSEQRRREAEDLAWLARLLTTGRPDIADFARHVVQRLYGLLPARSVAMWILEPDGYFRQLATTGLLADIGPDFEMPSWVGFGARIIREPRAVWTPDLLADPDARHIEPYRKRIEAVGGSALLTVPLRHSDQVIGLLHVGRAAGSRFSSAEVDLVQAFADQAAIALEHIRLYEASERRRREAETLAEIAHSLNATLDVDAILQTVVERARELCGADMARIALREADSGHMTFRYWVNARFDGYDRLTVQPGQGLGGLVMQKGEPFRTDDWRRDPRLSKETLHVVEAEGVIAMMATPIRIDGRVEGLLYVDNRRPQPFTAADETSLERLAAHAAVALRNARLFAEIQAAGDRLQALSARLLGVQEAERRHIARELHDEVGQTLTAVKISLRRLAADRGSAPIVADSIAMVDRLLGAVRTLSLDLRPPMLDDLGLPQALEWFVRSQTDRAGLAARVSIDVGDEAITDDTAITCFRVAQEALTNVLRHAQAQTVLVELRAADGGLGLVVRDDGVGFDMGAARRRRRHGMGLGIVGMQERAELIGGRVEIASAAGAGTTVRAWFPAPKTAGT